MKNLFKGRKPGFYLTLIAAGLAIVGAIVYLIVYQATADPVTGTVDRVFNWLNFALILAGGLIALGGEALRLGFVPILAGACYAIGLARHLVETAYPLADVLTKVPFFGGNPSLAITFAVIFCLAALVHVAASFMEHNQLALKIINRRNKNVKKTLSLILAVLMALAMLTACGGAGTPATAENAKTFQFEGKFEEQGEYASMLNNAFLLTLAADGTAVCDKYAFANYDASDADSNPTYTQSYLSGTWKEVEKDGVPCLQIKLAYVDASGNESNGTTSYAYDVAGEYSFEMTYPVTPGQSYTRNAVMTGKEGTLYADDNAFIQAYKQEFVAPKSIGQFVDEENNVTAYLQADGTMLVYAGYDKFSEGKWSVTDEGVQISIGGSPVEVANDGNTASFSLERTMGEFTNEYTLVCADVSAIGTPEISEEAPYTAAMEMGGNPTTAELTLNGDGTGTLKVFMDIAVTYEQFGDAVILEAAGDLEGYAASIWENISHAYLLNADKSMLPVAHVWNADSLVLIALDDVNMKVQFPAYSMERDGFTYVLSEDGTQLTVTAPSEKEMGAFAQVWTATGAENWTVDGNTAAKAE